ncbi:MAG: hypothetical protein ABIT69_02355 [Sphingomicrobium sp.]
MPARRWACTRSSPAKQRRLDPPLGFGPERRRTAQPVGDIGFDAHLPVDIPQRLGEPLERRHAVAATPLAEAPLQQPPQPHAALEMPRAPQRAIRRKQREGVVAPAMLVEVMVGRRALGEIAGPPRQQFGFGAEVLDQALLVRCDDIHRHGLSRQSSPLGLFAHRFRLRLTKKGGPGKDRPIDFQRLEKAQKAVI